MSDMDSFNREIAIIGMAGRFPRADSVEAFWLNLKNGIEAITFFSEEQLLAAGVDPALANRPDYVKAKGILEAVELFDAAFFGFSPREAELMDPQQRLFLECAWEALENAGYDPDQYRGHIGVYAGSDLSTYLLFHLLPRADLLNSEELFPIALMGNDKDHLTLRVSYKLNLRGPSINIQTTCSTSLVAIHLACQSLLSGECDIVLAGGVSISLPQVSGYFYKEGMVAAPDGHCRAFDAQANGTVTGNGLGIVVLKRLQEALADGDTIHAVIKGSALNNDGALKIGYTAPSVDAQAEVVEEALAMAGVPAETVTYVETHGTGTRLGDPIEIAALTKAFRVATQAKRFCAIGSVKTNVGHLDSAAGVTGLIKTVLMLKHKCIPPSLNFERPNPDIDFANSPFFVNTKLVEWKRDTTPRRAGVSALGMGGTNAHVVLEEPPAVEISGPSRPCQLLTLSAKTESALTMMAARLARHLKEHPTANLADVAYTCHVGRKTFPYRCVFVSADIDRTVTSLETLDSAKVTIDFWDQGSRPIIFMFPGQGAQHVDMALGLYQVEPTFREWIDRCSEFLKPILGLDPRDVLYPHGVHIQKSLTAISSPHKVNLRQLLHRDGDQHDDAAEKLNLTSLGHPILFMLEYALAKLWLEWGVRPHAMIGHSIGEYVAACLAGVFSLEDALVLVARRAQLIQTLPAGAMLAVLLSEEQVQPWLNDQLSLAAVNTPLACVVSGHPAAIAALEQEMLNKEIACQHLHAYHAFHSTLMAPISEPFGAQFKQIMLNPPEIPFISNLTGTWITTTEATDPGYWIKHMRQTVRFSAGLHELMSLPQPLFLEIGPGRNLCALARQTYGGQDQRSTIIASLPNPYEYDSDSAHVLSALGQAWVAGATVDWAGFHRHEHRQRVPLPAYPFERRYYWVPPPQSSMLDEGQANLIKTQDTSEPEVGRSTPQIYPRPELHNAYLGPTTAVEQRIAGIWQALFGIERVGIQDNFFQIGGDSLLAARLLPRLQKAFPVELSLRTILETPTILQLAEVIEDLLLQKVEQLPSDDEQIDSARRYRYV